MRNGNVVLEINDTGPGLTEAELDIKYETYKDKHEGYYIKMGMEYAREKNEAPVWRGVQHNLRKLQKQGIKNYFTMA